MALNGVTVGAIILGILLQAVSAPNAVEQKEKPKDDKNDEKPEKRKDEPPPEKDEKKLTPWWKRLFPSGKAA